MPLLRSKRRFGKVAQTLIEALRAVPGDTRWAARTPYALERESTIQGKLIESVKPHGWQGYKVVSPSQNGFPDVCIVAPVPKRPALVSFVELKRLGEVPTPLQLHILRTLRDAGCFAFWSDNVFDVISCIYKRIGELSR